MAEASAAGEVGGGAGRWGGPGGRVGIVGQGLGEAQFKLGKMHFDGKGSPRGHNYSDLAAFVAGP